MPIKLGSVEVGIDNPPIDTKTYGRKDGAWIDLASAAALQFRQGTNADRLAMDPVPASGEPIYATDNYRLFIGDGTTTGGRGLVGDTTSYVICQPGDDLQAKYAQAKALTPGGSALSATNRATLFIYPGTYDAGSSGFDIDTDFVDIIGLGSIRWFPKVSILATGAGSFQIEYSASNVYVKGLFSVSSQATSPGLNRVIENCGGSFAFHALNATLTGGVPNAMGGTLIGCSSIGTSSANGQFCGLGQAGNVFVGRLQDCYITGRSFNTTLFQGVASNTVFTAANVPPMSGSLQGRLEFCAFTGKTTAGLEARSAYNASVPAAYTSTATISNASPAVVTKSAHGLLTGMKVQFTTDGALPTGLSTGTTYYVKVVDANTFQVAATLNGSSINTSSAGSGTHTIAVPTGVDGGWYSYCTTKDGEFTST